MRKTLSLSYAAQEFDAGPQTPRPSGTPNQEISQEYIEEKERLRNIRDIAVTAVIEAKAKHVDASGHIEALRMARRNLKDFIESHSQKSKKQRLRYFFLDHKNKKAATIYANDEEAARWKAMKILNRHYKGIAPGPAWELTLVKVENA